MRITVGQLIEQLDKLPKASELRFGVQHFLGLLAYEHHVEIVLDPAVVHPPVSDRLTHPPYGFCPPDGGDKPA